MLVFVGLGAGFIGSIVGLGGGLIVVPVLISMGFGPAAAAANSMFATLGNASASAIVYSRQRRVQTGVFVRLASAAVPGTVLGALASEVIIPSAFKILFAALLAACIAYMLLGSRIRESGRSATARAASLGMCAGFGAGIVSSFFGIGGGVIFVPVLVVVMGYAMRDSTATSQAVLVPVSIAAVASHAALGHPDYDYALLLMVGAIAGGFIGAKISTLINDMYLKALASATRGLAARRLVLDSVFGENDLF